MEDENVNGNRTELIGSWSQFVYGIGVGGEYPMTSTTALESKSVGVNSQTDDKLHRGRNVVLAFLMQGKSVPV